MPPTHILPRLAINTGLAHTILVKFLRDAVHKVGFERAIIALSGGLDSALVAYLIAEAIGPENVLAIRMPYKTSSPDSLADAQAVVDALGVRCDTVDITPMVDPLLARFRTYGPETPFSPLARFLDMLGVWSLLVASMLDTLTTYRHTSWGYAPVICFSVMLMAFAGSVITRNSDSLRHALPPWYGELMQQTTRQERRHLAYAWLRIPRKMRWRLNADQASFRVFVELVRLTSYYGARDRDDPWAIWQ